MNRIGFIVASVLVALMVLSSTLFIVDQRQFAVIYGLGEIKEVINEPGLKFKLPPGTAPTHDYDPAYAKLFLRIHSPGVTGVRLLRANSVEVSTVLAE